MVKEPNKTAALAKDAAEKRTAILPAPRGVYVLWRRPGGFLAATGMAVKNRFHFQPHGQEKLVSPQDGSRIWRDVDARCYTLNFHQLSEHNQARAKTETRNEIQLLGRLQEFRGLVKQGYRNEVDDAHILVALLLVSRVSKAVCRVFWMPATPLARSAGMSCGLKDISHQPSLRI